MPFNLSDESILTSPLYRLISELPTSNDGKNCVAECGVEYYDADGERLDKSECFSTAYLEVSFTVEADGKEIKHSFFGSLLPSDTEQRAKEVLDTLISEVREFYCELEGGSHSEILTKLAEERDALLSKKEEEKPPYDYKSFFINAGIITATLILTLLIIEKIIPALLR